MQRLLLIGLTTTLIACGEQYPPHSTESYDASYDRVASDVAPAPAPAPAADMANRESTDSLDSPETNYLAYRYGYGFKLPAPAVSTVMEKHMKTCVSAGADSCQVLTSSVGSYSEDNVQAQLSLRAAPGWIDGFIDGMRADVEAADGSLESSTLSAEDLTRQILDTDARLEAQRTLRDRLLTLLETRNAELKDLLELERELARVQGEIESAVTTLDVLRRRVSMSVVDISYSSQPRAVTRSAVSPIGQSLRRVVRNLSSGIAGVIDFVSVTLPWFIFVVLPLLWLVRRFWRKRALTKVVAVEPDLGTDPTP